MKRYLLGMLIAVYAAVTVNAQTMEIGTEDADLPGLETFIDGVISTQMMALDIPAVSISIVKDGKLRLSKGYGAADIDKESPATGDSLFRPGSISKLFTWTAVMQQVEAGNLDLTADVNTYLKTFQIPNTFDEPINLKHIMTHTSGFEDGFLGYLFSTDPNSIVPLNESLAKYVPRRLNKPGEYVAYSNYATALAGLIVQNVSGVPFNEYIKQKILTPLGMTNSSFEEPLPNNLKQQAATGYKREAGVYKEQPFEIIANFGPAGALSSTAADMAKFMLAHLNNGSLNGHQILKPETSTLMKSRQFGPDERLRGIGYGFFEDYINGHRIVWHNGGTLLFFSYLILDEQEDLGIYVSYMGQKGGQASGEIIKIFYDQYYPASLKKLTPPEDFSERAAKYAGTYKTWCHNQSTLEKVMSLIRGKMTLTPTADNTLLLTGAGQPKQFVEIGKNLFRQLDGPLEIAFNEDENGAIHDLYLGAATYSRAPTAENGLFTGLLPILSFLLFISVWTGWIYRRKDYKLMRGGERTAVRLSLAMSGLNLFFAVAMIGIISAYQIEIVFNVPTIFKAALWLPGIASIAALGVLWFACQSWLNGYWRMGRRIHYTLVALSGLFMLWFYYYWNLLGVQLA